MALIELNNLKKELKERASISCSALFEAGITDAVEIANKQAVVDAVPVVHARWIPTDMGGGEPDEAWVCSVCNEPWVLNAGTPSENNMNYCPNCGAKMDGKEQG